MVATLMFALRVALAVAVAGAAVALALATVIYKGLSGPMLDLSVGLGLSPPYATTFVAVLLTLAMPTLLVATCNLLIGRWLHKSVLATTSVVAIFGAGIYAYAHDWNFDSTGRPLTFLCPPMTSEAKPTIGWKNFDHAIGESCLPVTKQNARAIAALKRGEEPKELSIRSVAELNRLHTHRYGAAAVYVDSTGRLFDGPGWERQSTDLLRPITSADVSTIRAKLTAEEAEAKRKVAEAEAAEKQKVAEAEAAKAIRAEAVSRAFDEQKPGETISEVFKKADALERLAKSKLVDSTTAIQVVESKRSQTRRETHQVWRASAAQHPVQPAPTSQFTYQTIRPAGSDSSVIVHNWNEQSTGSYPANTYSNPTVVYVETTASPCVCQPQ